jgi:hypothetical protein
MGTWMLRKHRAAPFAVAALAACRRVARARADGRRTSVSHGGNQRVALRGTERFVSKGQGRWDAGRRVP